MENLSTILFYIGEVPLSKRDYKGAALLGIDVEGMLEMYHITSQDCVVSIKERGLQAYSTPQGSWDRPAAVYFFADREEISDDLIAILGISNPVILTVNIPMREVIEKMVWDGIFNVSFGTHSAVQYRDDIPAEWVIF